MLGRLFEYKQNKAFTSQIVIFMTMRLLNTDDGEGEIIAPKTGISLELRERIQEIEDEVIRENEAIWSESQE